jgi:hypothetical protein
MWRHFHSARAALFEPAAALFFRGSFKRFCRVLRKPERPTRELVMNEALSMLPDNFPTEYLT